MSYDKSGHDFHGAYTTATPGVAGITPGLTAVSYDGTNDYNNIYSAGLANDNLLLNPGFETAGAAPPVWANWSETVGDGALANEVVVIHEGADAAKMTAGVTRDTTIFQAISVTAGRKYRLRFYTRGDGTYDGQYEIWDSTNFSTISGQVSTGVTGTTYTALVIEFTAPVGCTVVRIYFYCPNTNGGVCYFDACELRTMDGFLGDEGTVLAWAKVADWEDGLYRHLVDLRIDASNYIFIRTTDTNNRLAFSYLAGGTTESNNINSLTETGFMCIAMTWSKSGDIVSYYLNGAANGTADTALGTWVGDLDSASTTIGAKNDTPDSVWDGPIGPVALWNTPLSATEIRKLSKV